MAASAALGSGTLAALRQKLGVHFADGVTLPYSWRVQQLKQLRRMFEENKSVWANAMQSDLGLNPEFGYLRDYELMVKEEIDTALANLKSWMKPKKVETPLILFPATSEVVHEPVGVVLIIAPWNYPIALLASPLVGAIAAGCAAVLKPSEVSPATSKAFAELVPKYLSPEAYAVVEGGVPETTELLKMQWDHIFYTGNTPVGKIVMKAAAEHLTPVTLELGGKSPCYVHSDASLDVAAHRIVMGKFQNCGQTCVAPDYLLVHRDVLQPLLAKMQAVLREFFTDSPRTSKDYSRIVAPRHVQRLAKLLNGHGGKVVCGGEWNESERYVAPTIVLNPALDSELMRDEIFGPILPVLEVSGVDEALRVVAKFPRPLASYVFTHTPGVQQLIKTKVVSGALGINEVVMQAMCAALPFGGVGHSGLGRYHGKHSFDTFSNAKSVLSNPTFLDPAVKYPPVTPTKLKLVRLLSRMPAPSRLLGVLGTMVVLGALVVLL